MLLEADSIVLIDLPPRSCSAGSGGQGLCAPSGQAALQSFFSLNNLTALRELAMQTAASHVEDLQLQWQAAGKTTLPLCGGKLDGLPRGSARRRPGTLRPPLRPAPPAALAGVYIDSKGQRSPELEQALALASHLGARC